MRIGEGYTARSQALHVWRIGLRMTAEALHIVVEIVDDDEDEIGACRFNRRRGGTTAPSSAARATTGAALTAAGSKRKQENGGKNSQEVQRTLTPRMTQAESSEYWCQHLS